MKKSKKETVQLNRRVSKKTKMLLEKLENEGYTLDYIIKDYVKLKTIEKRIWKRIDKKLNILIYAIKGERIIVIEKEKKKRKESLLQKIRKLFKK